MAFDGDPAGFYYMGGAGPIANSPADWIGREGFIFKFDRQHRLVEVFTTPADQSGVDWVDVGSDRQTIYYTSEGPTAAGQAAAIHVYAAGQPYDPDQPYGGRYRRIPVMLDTQIITSRLQALRLLPPVPGDPDRTPSGFLVATGDLGVLRLDPDGQILQRYELPGLVSAYYALNLTPDGQSFWTATYQLAPFWADYCPGGAHYDPAFPADCALYDPVTGQYTRPAPEPQGKLVRFHIASGAVTAGPISLQVEGQRVSNVWGLCVKGEYTAASNTCYALETDGNAVLDGSGQPIPAACRVPVYCPADPTHPDCRDPRAPLFIPPPPQHSVEGDTVSLQLDATVAPGKTALFDIRHLPAGLTGDASGRISGEVSFLAAQGFLYNVGVTVYGGPIGEPGTRSTSGTFSWAITEINGPPEVSAPPALTIPVGVPVAPIVFPSFDPDADGLLVTATGLPPGLTAPALVMMENYVYTLALTGTPIAGGMFTPTICVWDQQHGRQPVCATALITIANAAPDLVAPGLVHPVGYPLNVRIEAWDPDGHALSFTIGGLPAGLIHEGGGVVSGTPLTRGASVVAVTVADPYGGVVTKTFTWEIVDNRPPVCRGAVPSQALWPPNHAFVPVTIHGITDPDGDPIAMAITGIQQDEPVLLRRAGRTGYDAIIDGAAARVRAERAGGRDGRVYQVFFTATDGTASCTGSVIVGVPHDQGNAGRAGQQLPVDSGGRYDSLTGVLISGAPPAPAAKGKQK